MQSVPNTTIPTRPSLAPIASAAPASRVEATRAKSGLVHIAMELTKARLNALVLVTTAVGSLLATTAPLDWVRFGWTMLGTALAAASAAMLNQLVEKSRDAKMRRTQGRPLPSGEIGRTPVFIAGILCAYAGVAVLALGVNLLSASLALANVVIYVAVYTPLKPVTTLNTLVGAVCGAIPPMIGWAAVTGGLQAGAWLLGAILFVWQMPHFLALAWMYREDYERGGMRMLPVVDPTGEITARTMVLTSLLLAPLGLAITLAGLSGWIAAAINLVLALGMTVLAWGFYMARTDASARRLFLASITYLPIALGVLVFDRGSVSPLAALRSGRSDTVSVDVPFNISPDAAPTTDPSR
mgnify:CR=1 FL=1